MIQTQIFYIPEQAKLRSPSLSSPSHREYHVEFVAIEQFHTFVTEAQG